jgi:hypothetical protein
MAALEVSYITSALAATAGIRFEGTVPTVIFCYVSHHILLLVVPTETVLTELFTKIDQSYI